MVDRMDAMSAQDPRLARAYNAAGRLWALGKRDEAAAVVVAAESGDPDTVAPNPESLPCPVREGIGSDNPVVVFDVLREAVNRLIGGLNARGDVGAYNWVHDEVDAVDLHDLDAQCTLTRQLAARYAALRSQNGEE